MAESQYPFEYGAENQASIKGALSPERTGRYLVKAGFDFAYAMEIYLWNARLAKSFQFPLHVLEVTLRNAVNHHLQLSNFPAEWAFDVPSLNVIAAANSDLASSLNKGKIRLLNNRMKRADFVTKVIQPNHHYVPSFGLITTNDIIASLSLEFWVSMIDRQFETAWHPTLRRVFPNIAAQEFRSTLWEALQPIKGLRNRVAHYEPIFETKTLPSVHGSILDVISKRCSKTSDWVKHHSTFNRTWHEPPQRKQKSGRALSEICSPVSEVMPEEAPLKAIIAEMRKLKKRSAIVCKMEGKFQIVTADDIMNWLGVGIVDDLVEMRKTLADVVKSVPLQSRVAVVGQGATTGDARSLFFNPSVPAKERATAILITTDGTNEGRPVGLIFKPDFQ